MTGVAALAGASLSLSDESGAAGAPVTGPLTLPPFATRTLRLALR